MLAFTIFLFAVAICVDSQRFLVLSLQTTPTTTTSCNRRTFAKRVISTATASTAFFPLVLSPDQVSAATLADLQSTAQKARSQLDAVPAIIKSEEWDKVRAILITPPISDFWERSGTKRSANVMQDIADAVGDAGGDELSILEFREDLNVHLRYLDMAVYNNVFNPITVEGTAGATKELVRSYYEDPKNELKACIDAFDGVLKEIASSSQ